MLDYLLIYGQGPAPVPANALAAARSDVIVARKAAVATRRWNSDLTAPISASHPTLSDSAWRRFSRLILRVSRTGVNYY